MKYKVTFTTIVCNFQITQNSSILGADCVSKVIDFAKHRISEMFGAKCSQIELVKSPLKTVLGYETEKCGKKLKVIATISEYVDPTDYLTKNSNYRTTLFNARNGMVTDLTHFIDKVKKISVLHLIIQKNVEEDYVEVLGYPEKIDIFEMPIDDLLSVYENVVTGNFEVIS